MSKGIGKQLSRLAHFMPKDHRVIITVSEGRVTVAMEDPTLDEVVRLEFSGEVDALGRFLKAFRGACGNSGHRWRDPDDVPAVEET